MRNLLILGALILVAAAPVRAQDYPKAEVFGGYQYIRLNPGGANCQGIGGSAAGNLNNWFGVVGDFGYCRVTGLPSGTSAHAVNYLFGPRVTYRSYGKLTPFGHVLFGGQHFGVTGGGTANAFAMALGGGGPGSERRGPPPHSFVSCCQSSFSLLSIPTPKPSLTRSRRS